MSYSELTERQLGIAPAIIAVGISTLSKLFGSHSGKTTHAQRFAQAVNSGDLTTAKLLADQAYSHAYLENIPDRADWQTVWNQMLTMASGDILAYMQAKMSPGAIPGKGPGATPGLFTTALVPQSGSGLGAVSPVVLVGLGVGAFLLLRRRRT